MFPFVGLMLVTSLNYIVTVHTCIINRFVLCVLHSSSVFLFSVLHVILEIGNDFKVVLVKRLAFGKGELLEGHAWSSDDEIFAVAGSKIYLSKVSVNKINGNCICWSLF